jgi:hypothetical protein
LSGIELRRFLRTILKMEDDLIIKKIGIIKLNSSNYRTWVAITRAVIEAKDV